MITPNDRIQTYEKMRAQSQINTSPMIGASCCLRQVKGGINIPWILPGAFGGAVIVLEIVTGDLESIH
jgi:hypothetical protein